MKNFQLLPLSLRCRGLKCDAPGCDYKDEAASLRNAKRYLNKSCPKCGANLLTQADLRTLTRLKRFHLAVNLAAVPFLPVFWLFQLWRAKKGRRNVGAIRMRMDGSGKLNPSEPTVL